MISPNSDTEITHLQYLSIDDLNKLKDEELTVLVREGNENAFEILVGRYFNLISKIAAQSRQPLTYSEYIDHDDFVQEGLLGLLSASKSYDPSKNTSFKNYLVICVKNRFNSLKRTLISKSKIPGESIITIDEKLDKLTDLTETSPQEIIESKEYIVMLRETLRGKLSDLEYKVICLFLGGLSREEIAENLGISLKSVDNALSRAHNKLSR